MENPGSALKRSEIARQKTDAMKGEVEEAQAELARLRAENARLKVDNEILKHAAAYFARESQVKYAWVADHRADIQQVGQCVSRSVRENRRRAPPRRPPVRRRGIPARDARRRP